MANKAKRSTKPTNTLQRKINRIVNYLKSHKIIALLLLVVLLIAGNFAYNKYKDWDNAQMIKGLARDFPILVEQIEQATGLNLEIQSNCMTTTEKFSEGVKLCEWRVAKKVNENSIDISEKVVLNSEIFKIIEYKEAPDAYRVSYRNKYSCQLSGSGTIYFSCVNGVRDANVPKINELLTQN